MNIENAKPILFNTEMTRSILDGRKTVTRRVIKPQPDYFFNCVFGKPQPLVKGYGAVKDGNDIYIKAPYKTGDILYVREAWTHGTYCAGVGAQNRTGYFYKASENPENTYFGKWRPSIHMPKEAARIFLRVTDVRAERLHEITEKQAEKEGVNFVKPKFCNDMGCDDCEWHGECQAYIFNFMKLWDSTVNPADRDRSGWDANPWVWVIEFERIHCTKG